MFQAQAKPRICIMSLLEQLLILLLVARFGQMDAAQQYNTNGRGYSPLLDWAKEHTQQLQAPPAGQEVVITSGSNHAIDVCCSILQASGANLPAVHNFCAINVCFLSIQFGPVIMHCVSRI